MFLFPPHTSPMEGRWTGNKLTMKRSTTISDDPIKKAILIDPRTGQEIASGDTPTAVIGQVKSEGGSISRAPINKTKDKENE